MTKSFQRSKKKRQYGRERYENPPQDEKQRLVEYVKKNYKIRKIAVL